MTAVSLSDDVSDPFLHVVPQLVDRDFQPLKLWVRVDDQMSEAMHPSRFSGIVFARKVCPAFITRISIHI
jgi:hypothetical protein